MRVLFLCCFFLPLALAGQKSVEYYSGTLDSSMTWQADSIIITGDLLVPPNVVLTIDPGVQVLIKGAFLIRVDGQLRAIGDREHYIVFYPIDTTGFWTTPQWNLGWRGITFGPEPPGTDSSIMHCCKIGFSRGEPDKSGTSAGINMRNRDRLRISECIIHDNHALQHGGGITCVNSSPRIASNIIRNNVAGSFGGGIYLFGCAQPEIMMNQIRQNRCDLKGGGIYCHTSGALIQQNKIAWNKSISAVPGTQGQQGDGGGIYLRHDSGGARVINNRIFNNMAAGAAFYEESLSSEVSGNLITNNANIGVLSGAGLTHSKYANNTICNNLVIGALVVSSAQTWYNNIIYGNGYYASLTNLAYTIDTPWIHFSVIEGGFAGPGMGNFDANPVFMAPTTAKGIHPTAELADWRLQPSSPCIDMGSPDTAGLGLHITDMWGNPRVIGGIIDVGAHEAEASQGCAALSPSKPWGLYPNPASGNPRLLGEAGKAYTLVVMDMLGRIVYQGRHVHADPIPLQGSKPGIYLCHGIADGKRLGSVKWIKHE